jgi:hypothetical protein
MASFNVAGAKKALGLDEDETTWLVIYKRLYGNQSLADRKTTFDQLDMDELKTTLQRYRDEQAAKRAAEEAKKKAEKDKKKNAGS